MAYAGWLNPSPTSGSGNGSVVVGALSNNTGRSARSTIVTFKAVGVDNITRTVNQAGKTEFVTIQSAAAPSKSGGSLTITGTSNSKTLTFSKANDGITLTIPASYTANGVNTNNGVAITGDPGNTAEYTFSITFTIPENTSVDPRTCQIIVTTESGATATCLITQAAGDPTLSVSPASIDLPWDAYTGSDTATFTVTSNTSWEIE